MEKAITYVEIVNKTIENMQERSIKIIDINRSIAKAKYKQSFKDNSRMEEYYRELYMRIEEQIKCLKK